MAENGTSNVAMLNDRRSLGTIVHNATFGILVSRLAILKLMISKWMSRLLQLLSYTKIWDSLYLLAPRTHKPKLLSFIVFAEYITRQPRKRELDYPFVYYSIMPNIEAVAIHRLNCPFARDPLGDLF